jgi:hypothetical protein
MRKATYPLEEYERLPGLLDTLRALNATVRGTQPKPV